MPTEQSSRGNRYEKKRAVHQFWVGEKVVIIPLRVRWRHPFERLVHIGSINLLSPHGVGVESSARVGCWRVIASCVLGGGG